MLFNTLSDKPNQYKQLIIPKFLAILFIILTSVAYGLYGLQYFMPLISLILIYFWVLFLPQIYPIWFLFLIGIIEDSLTGLPLGISAFNNILFRWMIISQKRFIIKESFLPIWYIFVGYLILIVALRVLLILVFKGVELNFFIILIQFIITSFLYPILHYVFYSLYLLLLNKHHE